MSDTVTIATEHGPAVVDIDTRCGNWIVHVDPTTAVPWWHVTYEPFGAVAAWSQDVEDMRMLAAYLHAQVPNLVNLAVKNKAAAKRRLLRKAAEICKPWRQAEYLPTNELTAADCRRAWRVYEAAGVPIPAWLREGAGE